MSNQTGKHANIALTAFFAIKTSISPVSDTPGVEALRLIADSAIKEISGDDASRFGAKENTDRYQKFSIRMLRTIVDYPMLREDDIGIAAIKKIAHEALRGMEIPAGLDPQWSLLAAATQLLWRIRQWDALEKSATGEQWATQIDEYFATHAVKFAAAPKPGAGAG